MNFFTVCFAILASVVLTTAQYFGGYNNFGGFGFNSLTDNFGNNQFGGGFGGLGGLGGGISGGQPSVRDPRQNRGPVVFPASPEDGPMESSGVIVGASGYGFVPPSSQSKNF